MIHGTIKDMHTKSNGYSVTYFKSYSHVNDIILVITGKGSIEHTNIGCTSR